MAAFLLRNVEFLGWTGAALASLWDWMGGCAHLGQWAPSSKPFLGAPLMPQFVNNELMGGQCPHLGQWGSGWGWSHPQASTCTPQHSGKHHKNPCRSDTVFSTFIYSFKMLSFYTLIKQKRPNRFFPLLILIKLASRLRCRVPKFNLEMLAASSLQRRQQWCCNYQLIFCLNTTQRVSWIQTG